jgi:hypothetical protein
VTFTFGDAKLKNGFPVETCPYCGCEDCEAEFCDIGVGYQQIGPHHCINCGAFSIGAYDGIKPTKEESACGWYKSNRQPLPLSVSTINGRVIDSKTALGMYRMGLVTAVPFHFVTEKS